MQTTKKTKATTATESTTSSFTFPLRALHDGAAWVGARCPDLIPDGVPALAYVNPSWLAMAFSEYGRRLRAELADARGFDRLEPHLDALPGKVLTWNPNAQEIAALCESIDQVVDKLRNPPAPEPLPDMWHRMAAALGITLPSARHRHEQFGVREQAAEQLHAAIATNTPEKLTPVWMAFRRHALDPAPHPLPVRRAAQALVADKLLPAAFRDIFPAPDEELRRLSPIEQTPAVEVAALTSPVLLSLQGGNPPPGYSDLVQALGERVPRLSNDASEAFRDEIEALDRKRREMGFVSEGEASRGRLGDSRSDINARGYRAAVSEACSKGSAVTAARAAAAEWHEQYEAQRTRVVAAFDAALAAMPIGIAWYYTREVREQVATLASIDRICVEQMLKAGGRVELHP